MKNKINYSYRIIGWNYLNGRTKSGAGAVPRIMSYTDLS